MRTFRILRSNNLELVVYQHLNYVMLNVSLACFLITIIFICQTVILLLWTLSVGYMDYKKQFCDPVIKIGLLFQRLEWATITLGYFKLLDIAMHFSFSTLYFPSII